MYNSVSTSSPDFQELLGESAPSDDNATLTTSVSVPEMEEDIHRRYVVNPEVTTALGPEFQSLSLAEHLVALNPTNPSSFMISSKVARSQLVRVMFRVLKLEDANRKLKAEVVAALRDHNKIFRLYYAEKHDRRHDRKDDRLKILSLEEDNRLLRTHVDYLKDDSQRHQQKNAELTSKLAQSERFFDALLDVKTCGPVLRDAVSAINEGGSAEEELVHAIMSAYAREDSIWRRIIDAVAGPRCPDVQAHESPVAPLWPGDIPPSNSQISEVYHQVFDDSNSDLSQVSPEVVSVGSVEENGPGSSAGEKEREAEVSPMTSLPVEQQEEVIKVTPATSSRRKSPVKATPARASPSKVPTPARNVPVSAPPSRVRAAPGHSRTTSVPIRPRVAAHPPAVRSSLPSTLSRVSPPLKAPSTMSAPRTVGTIPKSSISRSANAVPGPSRVQSSGASTARSLLKAPSAVPRKRSPLGNIDLNRAQTTSDGNGEEDERSLPAHGPKPVESLPKPAARPLGKRHARIIVEKLDLPPSNDEPEVIPTPSPVFCAEESREESASDHAVGSSSTESQAAESSCASVDPREQAPLSPTSRAVARLVHYLSDSDLGSLEDSMMDDSDSEDESPDSESDCSDLRRIQREALEEDEQEERAGGGLGAIRRMICGESRVQQDSDSESLSHSSSGSSYSTSSSTSNPRRAQATKAPASIAVKEARQSTGRAPSSRAAGSTNGPPALRNTEKLRGNSVAQPYLPAPGLLALRKRAPGPRPEDSMGDCFHPPQQARTPQAATSRLFKPTVASSNRAALSRPPSAPLHRRGSSSASSACGPVPAVRSRRAPGPARPVVVTTVTPPSPPRRSSLRPRSFASRAFSPLLSREAPGSSQAGSAATYRPRARSPLSQLVDEIAAQRLRAQLRGSHLLPPSDAPQPVRRMRRPVSPSKPTRPLRVKAKRI